VFGLAIAVVHEAARAGHVRDRPTEVDLDIGYAAVPYRQHLGVSEAVVVGLPFKGNDTRSPAGTMWMKSTPSVDARFGQQRSKYVFRSIRLSSGLVK
jgi:hypothetical protein